MRTMTCESPYLCFFFSSHPYYLNDQDAFLVFWLWHDTSVSRDRRRKRVAWSAIKYWRQPVPLNTNENWWLTSPSQDKYVHIKTEGLESHIETYVLFDIASHFESLSCYRAQRSLNLLRLHVIIMRLINHCKPFRSRLGLDQVTLTILWDDWYLKKRSSSLLGQA